MRLPNGQNDMSEFEMSRELGVSIRTPSHLLCALLFSSQKHVEQSLNLERIRADYRADPRNEGTSLHIRTTTFYDFDVLHFEIGVSSRRSKMG